MDKAIFTKRLIAWYAQHKRALPWRKARDPYKIWLSEVILQQTRVVQGLPYYERFVTAYPTVQDLAAASEEEILHLWQGLGYYSRARNLHKCSRYVVEKLGGVFPKSYHELLPLPGIGPYTAAAIASIAYDEPIAVVDGNVYRVLARLFGLQDDIASPAGQKVFQKLASSLIPSQSPGHYNEALMEFGALQCVPQQPRCHTCPFQNDCIAFQQKTQHLLPIKQRRVKVKERYLYYLLIHANDCVYVKQRKEKDIWHGLYDFYLIESASAVKHFYDLKDPLLPHLKAHVLTVKTDTPSLRHQLTHQRLHLHFFHVHATSRFLKEAEHILQQAKMIPHAHSALHKLPFPRAIHRFFEQATHPRIPI